MTTEPTPTDVGPEPDVAAAELALGVLDGAERAAALRRVIGEPAFARDVERWRDHFALLFAGVPEVAAPPRVYQRVEAQINQSQPRRSVNPWKPTAIAASLAALAMTAVALRPAEAPPAVAVPSAPMIAAMALGDTKTSQPALYDADSGLVKMPGPMPIPAGRSAQLWVIESGAAPKPLGLFRADGPGTYVAEARMGAVIAAGTTLAISIEPIGGSPTGQPTGPVIASGLLSKV